MFIEIKYACQHCCFSCKIKEPRLLLLLTPQVKARTTETNIAATIESLGLCLPVLAQFSRLSKQMKDKKYHPALKTLEQLETVHLPRIANYRFSKQMREQIPLLRESIKEASMTDLKDFLENIRKYSPKMGEIAMRHTAEQLEMDLGGGRQNMPQTNPFTGENDYEALSESTYDTEEDLSAPDLVDFSPVYRFCSCSSSFYLPLLVFLQLGVCFFSYSYYSYYSSFPPGVSTFTQSSESGRRTSVTTGSSAPSNPPSPSLLLTRCTRISRATDSTSMVSWASLSARTTSSTLEGDSCPRDI